MNKIFATIAALGQAYVLFPVAARATAVEGLANADAGLVAAAGTELSKGGELPAIIAGIINVLLGVLGIIFLVLVVYSGFLYLTAQGSDEPVKKARKILTTSIIGLILIVAAYAISSYVISALSSVASVT